MYGRFEHSIYGLKRIDSQDIFYVGLTGDMKRRLKQHRQTYGKDIEMVLLDYIKERELSEPYPAIKIENWWIVFMAECGHPIINKPTNYRRVKNSSHTQGTS